MPHVRLTDASISKLPNLKAQITYWDQGGLSGFGVRVGARRKTFVLMVSRGRRIKLGNYPFTSLKDARLEAYRLLSDPAGQKLPMIAPPAGEVVEKFLDIHHARSKPRWRKEQERLLTRHLLKPHKDTPLNRLTTQDILAIIDELQDVPSEQLHAYRALKTMFTWAKKRKVIASSPLDELDRPNDPTDRERVLSDDEIVKVYRAAQKAAKAGQALGYIILIIFHTAIRPGKVGELKRSYVTLDKITLPGDATKNKREHVLPNLISGELSEIPIVGNSDYFFPNAVGGPLKAFGKLKKQFDEVCGVTNWTLHDIRRTVRTKLAEWGCCDDAMAERILGHVTAESRISRVYNRWKYFPQMKAALEVYEERLAALLARR